MLKKTLVTVSMLFCVTACGKLFAAQVVDNNITEAEVNAAQQAWCDALVKIGKLKEEIEREEKFKELQKIQREIKKKSIKSR